MWSVETFFAVVTGALIQFFTAFFATWAVAVIFQISAVVAALTDAVCRFLVAVFAGAAGTGAAGKGTAAANLIYWIHFYLTFISSGLGLHTLLKYVVFCAIFQWVFSDIGLFK